MFSALRQVRQTIDCSLAHGGGGAAGKAGERQKEEGKWGGMMMVANVD